MMNSALHLKILAFMLCLSVLSAAVVATAEEPRPPSLFLQKSFQVTGDLNGDGTDEVALILVNNPGGSGTFIYLTVLAMQNDKIVSYSAFVGDRVQVRSGEIKDGILSLQVIQAGKTDPSCCPSQKALRSWTLGKSGLEEQAVKILGRLSAEDIAGTQWVLVKFSHEDAPSAPPLTLTYKKRRISGQSACNNYFAQLQDDGEMAGQIKMGPVGSTGKMCNETKMKLEKRYLQALAHVTSFSFLGNQLILSWNGADKSGYLVFKPAR